MLSEDSNPSWRSVVLLVLVAVVSYLLALHCPALRQSDEALYGAFSQEVVSGSGATMQTALYGHAVPGFPLYSWLVALCSLLRMPSEFSLRLPAVLSLFGIALLSGLFARRIQKDDKGYNGYAGLIAAAVCLTAFASFRTGVRAQSEILMAFFLCAAWYAWYALVSQGKRWWLAWICSLLLVFLAQFAAGFKALFLFYLPYFFMHSRFRLRIRMQAPSHIAPLCIYIVLTVIWLFLVSGQPYLPWNAIQPLADTAGHFGGYFSHLISMFPKVLLYLFPWTLFAWTPFCLALRQFEKDAAACRYLRAIIGSHAVFFWLLPGGSPLHLLAVLGPMAVLIGVYAKIVMRRYPGFWKKLGDWSAWVLLAGAACSMLFWLAVLADVVRIGGYSRAWTLWGVGGSAAVLVFTWLQILSRPDSDFHLSCLLWDICGYRVLAILLLVLPMAWREGTRRNAGKLLAVNVASDKVYLDAADPAVARKFLVETFYMQTHLISVKDTMTDLPEEEPVIWLLSSRVPAVSGRELTPVGPRVGVGRRPAWTVWCRGVHDRWSWSRPLVEIRLQEEQTGEGLPELRLYRAERKQQ